MYDDDGSAGDDRTSDRKNDDVFGASGGDGARPRSQRSIQPTWKLLENFESEQFWKVMDSIRETIGCVEVASRKSVPMPDMIKQLEHCEEDLRKIYSEVRSTFYGTVPPQIRQTVDRYFSDIKRLTAQLDTKDVLSQHSSVESRLSNVSSKRAFLAKLRAEQQAKKLEDSQRSQIAQIEADEKVRRIQYETEIEQLKLKLSEQKLLTEIDITEAEIRALSEDVPVIPPNRTNNVANQYQMPVSDNTAYQMPVSNNTAYQMPVSDNTAYQMPVSDNTAYQMPVSDHTSHQMPVLDNTAHLNNYAAMNIMRTFTETINQSRLSIPEPDVFDGNPLNFPMWKASFSALIESRNVPPSEKLLHLKKYVSGEALQAIEGIFFFDSEHAYENAKQILDQRYGNPFLVSEAFRNKLENWPKINSKDHKALRRYVDFLRHCLIAIDHVPSLAILNDCRENRKMLMKLPDWLVRRWGRIVTEYTDKGSYPKFADFVMYLKKESDICCNPVMTKPTEGEDSRRPNLRNAMVNKQANTNVLAAAKPELNATTVKTCVFCKRSNHVINKCWQFKKKSTLEKQDFVKKNGLCFGCLAHGHMSKDCSKRNICEVCNKKHPTCLHVHEKIQDHGVKSENLKSKSENQEALTSQDGVSHRSLIPDETLNLSTMILPVYVSSSEHPDDEILVYALLDTQSDTTFILEDTLNKLDVKQDFVKLKLSTMTGTSVIESKKVWNLQVRGMHCDRSIALPISYSRDFIPANLEHIPTPEKAEHWDHLKDIACELAPKQDVQVALLIGYNCPEALVPIKTVTSEDRNQPYAVQTHLGWGVVGRTMCEQEHISHRIISKNVPENLKIHPRDEIHFVCRTVVKEVTTPDIVKILESDFPEKKYEDKTMSQEDLRFLEIIREGIHRDDEGYYEMPLPFRDDKPNLPDNLDMARKRLYHLKRRFKSNSSYFDDYKKFMKDILKQGDAEEVPEDEKDSPLSWYIPHHGIYHPKKPGKIRVVFDCSARWKGQSLNDYLLQGPDMLNSLTGVLCRFREQPIAVIGDIERMFHRFRVSPDDRNYLRFLWWKDGNIDAEPAIFRMKVHLFGATSSPGCANYGLKKIAADNQDKYGIDAYNFLTNSFYVDDGLACFSSVDEAIRLVKDARDMCSEGNLRLHKFISNNKKVLNSIPQSEHAHATETKTFAVEDMNIGKVLGIEWCIDSDKFQFKLTVPSKPLTRRGLLSTVASVYDPLGFLAPFVLQGKLLLQQLCKENSKWDEPLPETLKMKWERWLTELPKLSNLQIERCFIPPDFGEIINCELHHFSDASFTGYGECSYLRLRDQNGQVCCSLVMGKSRVAPMKPMTVPRLELTAAVISQKISVFLRNELSYNINQEYFWTDSKIVLGYINNDARRFHVFVANRVQRIKSSSDPSQWRYIAGEENPADHASRGLRVEELLTSNWLVGPDFLWSKYLPDDQLKDIMILHDDPEVRKIIVNTAHVSRSILQRLEVFSKWHNVVIAITMILKLISRKKHQTTEADRCKGELTIMKLIQIDAFKSEIEALRQGHSLPKHSKLQQLDPFLDQENIMRVGGRLSRSTFSYEVKHPIILPQTGHLINLLIHVCHQAVAHQGRGFTMNELRSRGYWIIGCSKAVSSLIFKCVTCRKLRGKSLSQKMADLPVDRLEMSPPFTYCGMDCFGPFVVKEGRRELKRYGLIITCMASRAIHVETLDDMTTDAFINGLRCFIAIRGPVQILRCDQGSNFIGARQEFGKLIKDIKDDKIQKFMESNQVKFIMNSPHASHMGGAWERHIHTIRSVLAGILNQNPGRIDTSTLRTFLYECMAIINSRPLTTQDLQDPHSEPLTPNHLITMKTKLLLPPPGNFSKEDIYARKRWRRTQYLVDQFWTRWRKEYLTSLQSRQKWFKGKRNLTSGDIVILKDDNIVRGHWRLAKVLETITDDDNLVRRVKLLIGDPELSRQGKRLAKPVILERPIHKLTLLLEAE